MCKIILKQVLDPERFGVVEFKGDKIVSIVEKPKEPKSNWIITGFYLYDNRVFDIIRTLKPSIRGEYEVTDVSTWYLEEGTLTYYKTKGEWIDAGTFDSLLRANNLISGKMKKEGK